jgi:diaminobutyrate-2-oxoglutarate transaminase
MNTIERLESEVRSYCRSWPTVFESASGSFLIDEGGRRYLDFFSGAGALNYGHNHPALLEPLLDYLRAGHIVHGLDMATTAKRMFLERFEEVILRPRGLDYKVMFTGPTGTNAVEAALKLVRKVAGREDVISFTNAFHGMTLGSLAVSGDQMKRGGAQVPLNHTQRMPYDGYFGPDTDTIDLLEVYLSDAGSGFALPAAAIVETVQGEGGLSTASIEWMQRLAALCRQHGILLIVDDIQAGCGRTGSFFSFEEAGIVPDLVTLSKSLSGYGLPMAVLLLKPELDVWAPGEHNGTFRGNNPAFVTATAALKFWEDDRFAKRVQVCAEHVAARLAAMAAARPELEASVVGRGLLVGLSLPPADLAREVASNAFERGLLVETSGAADEAIKLMPPLTVSDSELDTGLDVLEDALDAALRARADAEQVAAC